MKPIIGVSGTQLLNPARGFEGTLVAYTPQNYIDTVQGVGATPIMLPVGTAEDAKKHGCTYRCINPYRWA